MHETVQSRNQTFVVQRIPNCLLSAQAHQIYEENITEQEHKGFIREMQLRTANHVRQRHMEIRSILEETTRTRIKIHFK